MSDKFYERWRVTDWNPDFSRIYWQIRDSLWIEVLSLLWLVGPIFFRVMLIADFFLFWACHLILAVSEPVRLNSERTDAFPGTWASLRIFISRTLRCLYILGLQGSVTTHTVDGGPSSSPAGDSEPAHCDETRSNDAHTRPDHTTAKQTPLDPMEDGGDFKDKPQTSTYLELFEKARKAHYLRHRTPPESERLLSIAEIFGHKEFSQSRAEKGCENRVTI